MEFFDLSTYDLEVLIRSEDQLTVNLDFNANLYDTVTMERIVRQFKYLFNQVLKNEEIYIHQLNLLSEQEKSQLLQKIRDKRGKPLLDNIEVNQKPAGTISADFDY